MFPESEGNHIPPSSVVVSTTPDIISLQLCSPKFVGVYLSYTQSTSIKIKYITSKII
jgi:hypothetical protein